MWKLPEFPCISHPMSASLADILVDIRLPGESRLLLDLASALPPWLPTVGNCQRPEALRANQF